MNCNNGTNFAAKNNRKYNLIEFIIYYFWGKGEIWDFKFLNLKLLTLQENGETVYVENVRTKQKVEHAGMPVLLDEILCHSHNLRKY